MEIIQYCIMRTGEEPEIHAGPWSEQESIDWLQSMEDDGVREDVYFIATRTVTITDWQAYP